MFEDCLEGMYAVLSAQSINFDVVEQQESCVFIRIDVIDIGKLFTLANTFGFVVDRTEEPTIVKMYLR